MRTILITIIAVVSTALVHTSGFSAEKQATAVPKDPVVWRELDPSNPQHAAIIGWHRAIVSKDYDAYLRYVDKTTASRIGFNSKRETTPPTILIASEAQHTNPNGSQDFGVAGCKKESSLFGEGREIRLVAMVTPVFKDGQWKIFASDFAPPWNNLVRVCPRK